MSIQHIRRDLNTVFGSLPRSLIMLIGTFSGMIVGPLVFFVVGGKVQTGTGYPDLPWMFVAIAILQLLGIGAGILMFRRESKAAKDTSIMPEQGSKKDEVSAETGRRAAVLSLVQSNGAGSGRAPVR